MARDKRGSADAGDRGHTLFYKIKKKMPGFIRRFLLKSTSAKNVGILAGAIAIGQVVTVPVAAIFTSVNFIDFDSIQKPFEWIIYEGNAKIWVKNCLSFINLHFPCRL